MVGVYTAIQYSRILESNYVWNCTSIYVKYYQHMYHLFIINYYLDFNLCTFVQKLTKLI